MAPHEKPPVDTIAVGERLRLLRTANGWTQKEMAPHLGVASNSAVSQFEKGRIALSLGRAVHICDKLGVTLDWLLRGNLGTLSEDMRRKLYPGNATGSRPFRRAL